MLPTVYTENLSLTLHMNSLELVEVGRMEFLYVSAPYKRTDITSVWFESILFAVTHNLFNSTVFVF